MTTGESSGEDKEKQKEDSVGAGARTPSNQTNAASNSGKATPTKGSNGHGNGNLPSGNPSRNASFLSRPGSNLTPGRISDDGATPDSQIMSEAEEEPLPPPPPVKKEPNVIIDSSLNLLSTHIVQKRLLLAMYLNVPTADLVKTDSLVREEQMKRRHSPTLDQLREQLAKQNAHKESFDQIEPLNLEQIEQEVAFRLLKHWRSLKGNAKDKDKVMELVRALKMIERIDLGEIITTQNKTNNELTLAVLPVIKALSTSTAASKPKKIKSTTKKSTS